MVYRRLVTAACTCFLPGAALAQSSYVAPDGVNRYPGVTIFCANGTHVQPCSFGGGSGGSSGSVTITLGGTPVSSSNKLPVSDSSLDALIGGGALSVGGTVSVSGTPTVAFGSGAAVALSTGGSLVSSGNPLQVKDTALDALIAAGALSVGGTVSLAGTPTVAFGSGASVALSTGGSLVSSGNPLQVKDATLDALIGGGALSVGGTVSLSGTSSVAISGTPSVTLGAGTSAIGTVSVSGTPTVALASGTSLGVSSVGGTVTTMPASGGTQAVSGAVTLSAGTSSIGTVSLSSNTVTLGAGSSNIGTIAGSSANLPAYLQAVSSGGATSVGYINAAAGSAMATSVKTSGALLYFGEICNSNASTVYFRTFNQIAAPTVGTSVPTFRLPVPATSCVSLALNAVGVLHANGLAFDVTSGSMADNDTGTLATANTVTVNLAYK